MSMSFAKQKQCDPKQHLLNREWTWTFQVANSAQQEAFSVSTVEAFWSYFNNCPQPSQIATGSCISFFESNFCAFSSPSVLVWRYKLQIEAEKTEQRIEGFRKGDVKWRELLMALIGEQLGEYSSMIKGCCVKLQRRGCFIELLMDIYTDVGENIIENKEETECILNIIKQEVQKKIECYYAQDFTLLALETTFPFSSSSCS